MIEPLVVGADPTSRIIICNSQFIMELLLADNYYFMVGWSYPFFPVVQLIDLVGCFGPVQTAD